MKKAFTLVELLAVIVLIGLIATKTVPVISGVIENNKKQSIVINTEKTIKAVETYKTTYELETGRELKNASYKIENKKVIGLDLSINGTLPESGEITIDENGLISLYVYDSGYCAVKNDSKSNIKIIKINIDNCNYNS